MRLLRFIGAGLLAGMVLVGGPGCAAALVNADAALHRAVSVSQDTADVMCDVGALNEEACQKFNMRLVIIIGDAKAFNRAVRDNNYGEVPAMMRALLGLRDEAMQLFQDPAIRESVIARIESAYQMLSLLRK
jgi:hypothetical protein